MSLSNVNLLLSACCVATSLNNAFDVAGCSAVQVTLRWFSSCQYFRQSKQGLFLKVFALQLIQKCSLVRVRVSKRGIFLYHKHLILRLVSQRTCSNRR